MLLFLTFSFRTYDSGPCSSFISTQAVLHGFTFTFTFIFNFSQYSAINGALYWVCRVIRYILVTVLKLKRYCTCFEGPWVVYCSSWCLLHERSMEKVWWASCIKSRNHHRLLGRVGTRTSWLVSFTGKSLLPIENMKLHSNFCCFLFLLRQRKTIRPFTSH